MAASARFMEQFTEQPIMLLGPEGKTAPLPLEVYRTLVKAVSALQSGKAIMVAPLDQHRATQQAADFLGIN